MQNVTHHIPPHGSPSCMFQTGSARVLKACNPDILLGGPVAGTLAGHCGKEKNFPGFAGTTPWLLPRPRQLQLTKKGCGHVSRATPPREKRLRTRPGRYRSFKIYRVGRVRDASAAVSPTPDSTTARAVVLHKQVQWAAKADADTGGRPLAERGRVQRDRSDHT
eukprot:gene14552-biopygen2090